MEKSEMLVNQLQEFRGTFHEIEEGEFLVIESPDMQLAGMNLTVMERVLNPNDERIQKIYEKFKKVKKDFSKKRELYRDEENRLRGKLEGLTLPAIEVGLKKLYGDLTKIELRREIIRNRYDGVRRQTFLEIRTNQDAVELAREVVRKGVEELQKMRLESVPAIQTFVEKVHADFGKIDLAAMVEKVVDEVDYYRFSPPPPAAAGATYAGPLSGTTMGPPEIVSK